MLDLLSLCLQYIFYSGTQQTHLSLSFSPPPPLSPSLSLSEQELYLNIIDCEQLSEEKDLNDMFLYFCVRLRGPFCFHPQVSVPQPLYIYIYVGGTQTAGTEPAYECCNDSTLLSAPDVTD